MKNKHRILIVDDHPMFRDGVKAIISGSNVYQVVAEAGSCAEGLELGRSLQPGIVIIDISLPDGSGIDLARNMAEYVPEAKILMLSMHSKADFIVSAFQAGALAFLAKDSSRDQLLHALEVVTSGRQYLDGAISPRVLNELLLRSGSELRMVDASYATLSRREQQVLRLLAEGMVPAAIADRLFISRKTVENHRTNLLNKLDIKSPVELVRYAARMGLIDLDA
jgi:DNA-binding NarL/FixJ family response regulator